MPNSVTHFEIYAQDPAWVANFYRNIFGWRIEQMPGIDCWRIDTGSAEGSTLAGGLTYRAILDLNKLAIPILAEELQNSMGTKETEKGGSNGKRP